ncbi:MAG: hypothetical protein K6T35_09465, partial [Meiothermus silvanus]|nr:hypothetical protein [Allomeiothermus silvanus]
LTVMAARDPRDPLWTPAPLVGESLPHPIRAALVTEIEGIPLHTTAVAAVRSAGECLAAAGYQVEEVTPPQLTRVAELWHPIGLSDLNLSLRPLLKDAGDPGIERFINFWWELKGGADLPSYLAALAERDTLLRAWNLFLETYPIIIMPSCSEVALPVNVDVQDAAGAARMLDALRLQLVLPVLGLPGLAVPTAPVDGLPMGVQIVSRRYREDLARYQEAQTRLAELIQRKHALQNERQGIEARLREITLQETGLAAQEAELGLAVLEADLREARHATRALADEESRLLSRTNAVLAELEQSRITRARREATLEALQTEQSELPPVEGELPQGSHRTLTRQLAEAEAALQALGAVNHLAEAEHHSLAEQAETLQAALREAEEVMSKLEAELEAVEREYQGKLTVAYGRFRHKFAEYAEALLGAEARLEMLPSPPSSGLPHHRGLHLVLRPAGKRTVDLNLLSMGERTMGALAFLFALSEASEEGRGLPVAVLDEVDAPLDEANILRFAGFLRRFSQETQFILITHQKRTMEAFVALYGLSREHGLRLVYSIQRDEALA